MFGPYERSAEVYDAFYGTLVDYETNADKLRELLGGSTQSVLEIACGTGAYAARLAQWFDVTGLDISPEMLGVARGRVPEATFVEADMTDFDLGRQFDAVLCLFSSIGYAATVDQLTSIVSAMARHTSPGGMVIVEPWVTPDNWIDDQTLRVHTAEEEDLVIARVHSSVRSENVVDMTWGFLVGRPGGVVEAFTEKHVTMLFSHEEYLESFTAVGLVVEHDEEGLMGRGLYIGTKPG